MTQPRLKGEERQSVINLMVENLRRKLSGGRISFAEGHKTTRQLDENRTAEMTWGEKTRREYELKQLEEIQKRQGYIG